MSLKAGRILGVSIRIHYTLVLTFLLIAGTLSVGFMPREYPGLPPTTYIVIGVVGALLLFVSVLIHELAHSLVAKRNGLRVRQIVLFIFGGVSELEDDPRDSSVEFKVAVVGPLTSFAIAAILWVLWNTLILVRTDVVYLAVLQYGSFINLILGGFNLIPAFPMDGGRVFRSVIWRRRRDKYTATRIASRVGVGFAYVFIGFGLVIAFTGNFIGGIWLVFIGWFLRNGSESGLMQATISEALGKTRVGDVMTTSIHTVKPGSTLKEVIDDYLLVYKHGGYPVVLEGKFLGIITLNDVKRVPKEKWTETHAQDVMTPVEKIVSVGRGVHASEALMLMSTQSIGRLPVLENGTLVGIISRSDLMKIINLKTELMK